MTKPSDRLAAMLDQTADAAEDSAGEQRRAARTARVLARRRERGATGVELAAQLPAVLGVLSTSAQRLTGAVGGVRRAWVQTLAAEGQSIRQIGSMLGVTHQRILALLRGHPRDRDLG